MKRSVVQYCLAKAMTLNAISSTTSAGSGAEVGRSGLARILGRTIPFSIENSSNRRLCTLELKFTTAIRAATPQRDALARSPHLRCICQDRVKSSEVM